MLKGGLCANRWIQRTFSLDFTIVDLLGKRHLTSIQLGKRWVDSVIGSKSSSSHMHKDDEMDVGNHSHKEDPKTVELTHKDTSNMDFAFESFFDDQSN